MIFYRRALEGARKIVYRQSSGPDKTKFYERPPYITITNVCNLSCGGCSQLCGHFEKEKLWFISLGQLRVNIEAMSRYVSKEIYIFGGEPTLHPEFDEIKKLLYSFADCRFIIFSNGRLHRKEDVRLDIGQNRIGGWASDTRNVRFLIDFKMEYGKDGIPMKMFNPTLVAPIDVLGIEDRDYYWQQAKRHCICWNKCGTTIYNDKAYICEVAPAIDHLAGESNGWPVVPGEDPFDRTDEEIAEQARKFCYRCAAGYSNDRDIIADQRICDKSLVSKTNMSLISDQPRLRSKVMELPMAPR